MVLRGGIEAISVGDIQIALPGIGSYVARAIEERDLPAIGWAIAAMTIATVLYDQLLFRPLADGRSSGAYELG